MYILLILSCFTIIAVESEKFWVSQHLYVPKEDPSTVLRDEDDDDLVPEDYMTTVGIRDYIDDDLDDEPVRNKTKSQKHGYSDDSYAEGEYRPTKKMVSVDRSRNFLIGTNLHLLKNEVPYSDEPWPTITLSTFDVMVPMIPTWPSKTTPPTFRSHFPPMKGTPSKDEPKRNVSRQATSVNFPTELASKFDVGILDRFIYPEEYVVTTPPAEEYDDNGVPTFLSRSTMTAAYSRPTIPWFNQPKPKDRFRVSVLVKLRNSTHKGTPSPTATVARNRLSGVSGYSNRTKTLRGRRLIARQKGLPWYCYTCGLNLTAVPDEWCHKVFSSPDGRYRGMMIYYQTDCLKQSMWTANYKHGCFWRYLDVGGLYEERGCRDYPPRKGASFASKKFQRLEQLLKLKKNGCVNSPYAILMPFSRAVQLYARFHVCVCRGKFCNASSRITPEFVALASLFWCIVITIRETGVLL